MGYSFRSYRIIFIFLFSNFYTITAQTIYTENALMGKGDLPLIGAVNKLQPEVYKAYIKMRDSALQEGISIDIASAYRSYNRQATIWNRKYLKYLKQGLTPLEAIQKIISYSTLPGTSRHHWGTDIDLIDKTVINKNNILNPKNYEINGCYGKLKIWLDENAEKFGFYLVYTNNADRKGFKYEPWHYSYKEIAKPMLQQFLKINKNTFYENPKIEGSKYINNEFIDLYFKEQLLDINRELK